MVEKYKDFLNENTISESTFERIEKNIEEKNYLDRKIESYLDMKNIEYDDDYYYFCDDDLLELIYNKDDDFIIIKKIDFDDFCENPDKYKKRRDFNL
jgi:hypothetical protein